MSASLIWFLVKGEDGMAYAMLGQPVDVGEPDPREEWAPQQWLDSKEQWVWRTIPLNMRRATMLVNILSQLLMDLPAANAHLLAHPECTEIPSVPAYLSKHLAQSDTPPEADKGPIPDTIRKAFEQQGWVDHDAADQ